jgi:hypothetical protein
MTSAPKQPSDHLDKLIDRMFDELEALPDSEVLEGEAAEVVKKRALGRLERARKVAGANRLAAARAAVQRPMDIIVPNVSLEEARAYIGRAANDARYTLAARQLGEMPPDEVMRIYSELVSLEQKSERDES